MGSTLAYFTTSTSITNIFKTEKYQPQIVEQFESPINWTPGTITSKTITITNDGTIASIINFNDGWE